MELMLLPTIQLYDWLQKSGIGDKNPGKRVGKIWVGFSSRQDVKHPGLSGLSGQPDVEIFATGLEWKLPGQALNP